MFAKIAKSALLIPLLAIAADAAPREIDSLVAVVNGQIVTRSEVDEAIKHNREMITLSIPPGEARTKALRSREKDARDSLIERELILAEFAKLGGSIKDELVEEDVAKIINSERFGGDRQKFLKELNATGMTLKRFKDLRRKILVVELMRARQSGGVKIITPQQLNDAYEKHGDKFREESFVRLRTLMIPKISGEPGDTEETQRKLIKDIRTKIVKGADFDQMAKTYSKDSVADKGGDRGTIGEESIKLRRDLKDHAFRLKVGATSEVIEDPYAFYLMKVESKRLGNRRPLSDPEVRDTAERLATLDIRKASHERWIAKLRKSASIRRFDSKGRPIPSTSKTSPTSSANSLPSQRVDHVAAVESEPKKEKKSLLARIKHPFGLFEKGE
jgi:peptidyl-prolyl cis-trans isomerase SurA